MQYPLFIHKDSNSNCAFGVTIPDLPGCFSAGESIEEAIKNSQEAIECHLEGLLKDGEPIPLKHPLEYHLDNPEFKDAILSFVDVDLSNIPTKSQIINITLPARVLKQIDDYRQQHGVNLSAFLTDAALNYMAEHSRI